MNPIYDSFATGQHTLATRVHWTDCLRDGTSWLRVTPARYECFMSEGGGVSYTYGSGRGERTYTSIPTSNVVREIQDMVKGTDPAGAFLERGGRRPFCFTGMAVFTAQ